LTGWSTGLVSVQVTAKAPSESTVTWESTWVPAAEVTVIGPVVWAPDELNVRYLMSPASR
jgi:hypothetical protein